MTGQTQYLTNYLVTLSAKRIKKASIFDNEAMNSVRGIILFLPLGLDLYSKKLIGEYTRKLKKFSTERVLIKSRISIQVMLTGSTNSNLLTPSIKLPLYGKRILVTAPRNYARRLSEQIIYFGGLPILMPTIETCLLENYTELDTVLKQINNFDWIVFTSRNGIDAFFQRMFYLGLPTSVLKNCQLCAIGKDSERLSYFCDRVDLIPAESSPAGIIAELSKVPNIQEQKVLVPVPEVLDIPEPNVIPIFLSQLQELGTQVTHVPAYNTRCLSKDIYEIELKLIRQGSIDVIAFSSTAEIESFLQMVNSKSDYENCVIACFGPYTGANAQDLGLNVSIFSKDYSSFAGFAEAIADFLTTA